MPSPLNVFNEALKRVSDPVNPPPARPGALDVSTPTSSLDPSLAGRWRDELQFTPPNTAIELTQAHSYSPSLRQGNTAMQRFQHHSLSQSFSGAEADFHQQAMAFDGMSQMHNLSQYLGPPGANTTLASEPAQSRAPAMDDLFSDVDHIETPDLEDSGRDDNMFEISGLGQPPQVSIKQESEASLPTISSIGQKPHHASPGDGHDFGDPRSHPSPTESQLVAEGFEFHDELPEDVQITRFNDKAFRKALREVQSDLPRKQQWYAWSKAMQMLNSEPESAVTEQMERSWGAPLERQDLDQPHHENEGEIWGSPAQPVSLNTTTHRYSGKGENAGAQQLVAQEPQPNIPSSWAPAGGLGVRQSHWQDTKKHGDWASRPERIDQDRLGSHPLGNVIFQMAEAHGARIKSEDRSAAETESTAQNIPSTVPEALPLSAGNNSATMTVIAKKVAEIQSLQSELRNVDEEIVSKIEQMKARILARRMGSAHGLLASSNDTTTDKQDWIMQGTEQLYTILNPSLPCTAHLDPSLPRSSAGTPPLPRRPSIERSTSPLRSRTSMHDADLLRPHTNTIIRCSPSPSRGHLPPPISPNRRSPSPWIEHPGINRPDTPRPSHPASHLQSDIRASIEPETPYSQRVGERESTPAYSNRSPSPSPSPVSHLGTSHTHANVHEDKDEADTEMIDAPTTYTAHATTPTPRNPPPRHFAQNSSPDPLSSPLLHSGNTYTAPSTPLPPAYTHPNARPHPHPNPQTFSPFRPPPPPIPQSPPSLKPPKTRRKSIGGQTSKSEGKPRNATATTTVQGSHITKSRNPTARKVTQVAQRAKKESESKSNSKANTSTGTRPSGNKVANAVAKIEEGLSKVAVEGSPRRSGRIAAASGKRGKK